MPEREYIRRAGGSRGMPGRGIAMAGAALLYALFLFVPTGCAPDFSAVRKGIEVRGHYIQGVPFFRQAEQLCGPAALAAVMTFWGVTDTPEQITECVYSPGLGGTLPMDMEQYLLDAGFTTTSSSGSLALLQDHIRQGLPAICLLDLGIGPYRKPHYVTVIGFDDHRRLVIYHDGLVANNVDSYDRFLRKWSRGGFWMLVARPEENTGNDRP